MPPVVDAKKCAGCNSCSEVCPTNVIEVVKEKAVVAHPNDCIDCRACEAACQNNAISFP